MPGRRRANECQHAIPLPNHALLESNRGRGRPAPSHTTGHAGPHRAVRQAAGLRRCQVWLRVFSFTFLSRLTQIAPPHTRFVFPGAGIHLGLPSHPASRRRSCLRLGVSTTSSSRGLSPPSDRPCRAYSRRCRCAAPRPALPAPGSGLGEAPPGAPAPPQPHHAANHTRPVRHAGTARHAGYLPRTRLSPSRSPRKGRASHVAARSAFADPGPGTRSQGPGSYQEDGTRPGPSGQWPASGQLASGAQTPRE